MSKPSNISLEYAKEKISKLIIYNEKMIMYNINEINKAVDPNVREIHRTFILIRIENIRELNEIFKEIS